MSFLLEWAVAATAILGLGLLVDRLGRRAPATTRHGHLLIACALVVAWPLLRVVAPEWSAPRATDAWWPKAESPAMNGGAPMQQAISTNPASLPSEMRLMDAPLQLPRTSAYPLALLAWSVISSLLLVTTLRRYWGAHRLVAAADQVSEGAWVQDAASVARQLGIPKAPRVATSSAVTSPVAWGFGGGSIILPRHLLGASAAARQAVLSHEMAHLARRDHLSQLVTTAVTVMHWYHPLAWMARGLLRRHAEMACDDAVVLAGFHPVRYADELLRLAVRTGAPEAIPLPGLFGSGDLEHRIASLTNSATRRHRPGRWRLTVAWAAAVVAVTSVAGIRPPSLAAAVNGPVPGTPGFFAAPRRAVEAPSSAQPEEAGNVAAMTWYAVAGPCPTFIGRRDLVRHCVHREIELEGASFTLDGGQNGDVVITGTDANRIRVRAIIDVQAADTLLAQALSERITIPVVGGVRPVIPPLGTQEWVGIAFVVEVPRGVPVRITTWNGAVRLRQLAGPIDITTLNGLIDIADVSGRVTASGNNAQYRVAIGGSSAAHQLESHNGNIELLVGMPGDLSVDLATTNGRLTLQGLDPLAMDCGRASEGCAGGRLSLNPARRPPLVARTTHGDITLRAIPPGEVD